jgi:hypothetical protein
MSAKQTKTKIAVTNPEPEQAYLPVYSGDFALANVEPGTSIALREARRIKDQSFDRIWKFYYEPKKEIQLTEFEEDMRKRLAHVWDLLTGKVLNDRKAVQAHVVWCKDNYMEITERTAYDDLRRSKQLFGDPKVNTPVFEKARISNILLDLIEIAKANKDLDNAQRLIRRYNAVNGLEDDIKTQLPRPAITINFNADEETLKKQAAELMQGIAVDTDFQDLGE